MWSIWNEPNQPQFLKPQYRKGKPYSPKLYRKLYQAAYAGPARDAGQRQGHDPDRRDLAARQHERRAPAGVPARDAVPGLQVAQVEVVRRAPGRRLRAPRVHDQRRPALQAAPNADDVTIGVLPRLVTALDRAAKAGALPAHLPIHLTEFGIQTTPDKISGVSLERQAAYLRGRRAHRLRQPARRVVLAVPDERRPAALERLPLRRGSRAACAAPTARPKPAYEGFRLPLAVEVYGRSDVLWGLVRPQRARDAR